MKKTALLIFLFFVLGINLVYTLTSDPPTLAESIKFFKENGLWFSFRGPDELSKDFQTYRRLIDKPSWQKEALKMPQDEYTTVFYDERRERIVFISSVFSYEKVEDIPRCLKTFQEARNLIDETFVREKIIYKEIKKEGWVFKVIVIIQLLQEL